MNIIYHACMKRHPKLISNPEKNKTPFKTKNGCLSDYFIKTLRVQFSSDLWTSYNVARVLINITKYLANSILSSLSLNKLILQEISQTNHLTNTKFPSLLLQLVWTNLFSPEIYLQNLCKHAVSNWCHLPQILLVVRLYQEFSLFLLVSLQDVWGWQEVLLK